MSSLYENWRDDSYNISADECNYQRKPIANQNGIGDRNCHYLAIGSSLL